MFSPSISFSYHSKAMRLLWILFICALHLSLLYCLLCMMFCHVFVTFLYGVPGKVWYLIVKIPDIYLLLFFVLCFMSHQQVSSNGDRTTETD